MSFIFKLLVLALVGVVVVRGSGKKLNGGDELSHLEGIGGHELGGVGGGGAHEEHSGEGYHKKEGAKESVKPAVIINNPTTTIIKDSGNKEEFFNGPNGIGSWIKYILNPCELIKKISEHFKVHPKKMLDRIDDRLVRGPEVIFEPLVVSFKIMERLFQNDICRRRFFCQIGSYLKPLREPLEPLAKFSSKIPTISNQIKVINQGIFDKDCERDFPECTPFLKKPFQNLGEDKEIKV